MPFTAWIHSSRCINECFIIYINEYFIIDINEYFIIDINEYFIIDIITLWLPGEVQSMLE